MLFLSLLLCILAYGVAQQTDLLLNNRATISSDIKRIYHEPKLHRVVIDLKTTRRCFRPTFMARLSGASLYLLELEHQNDTSLELASRNGSLGTHYVFRYPPIIDQGLHFLEVLALFCHPFLPHAIREQCVDTAAGGVNVVTQPYSFLPPPFTAPHTRKRPRWVLANRTENIPKILSTRHRTITDEEDRSVEISSQHELYVMADLPPLPEPVSSVLKLSHAQPRTLINICMVGCSHARGISQATQNLSASLNNTVRFIHLWSRYPVNFNMKEIVAAECSYAVVDYGQWPFSAQSRYTAEQYTREYAAVLREIEEYSNHKTGPVQFFVRSMNYVPFSRYQLMCPQIDFRTPPVVDYVNHAVKALAAQHHVEFIDTNFIMGPMWDCALDWSHPTPIVFAAEGHWILHFILESSLRHQRPIRPIEYVPPVWLNDTVRFGDANLYLYENSAMCLFPDNSTFIKMGYKFENVKALLPTHRKFFPFGDNLPKLV